MMQIERDAPGELGTCEDDANGPVKARSNFVPVEARVCAFGILDHMDRVCLCGTYDTAVPA